MPAGKSHIETLEQKTAFDYYYGLQNRRSLAKVSKVFNISKATAGNWSKWFKWQKRVIERDEKNAAEIEALTDKRIQEHKIQSIKELETHLNLIRTSLNKAIPKIAGQVDENGKIITTDLDIKNFDELLKAFASSRESRKLLLQILGVPLNNTRVSGDSENPVQHEVREKSISELVGEHYKSFRQNADE